MTFFARFARVRLIFVPHFEFSLKPLTCSNAATFILRPLSAGGGGISLRVLQEIHELSTETLWNMEERPWPI